MGSPNIRDLLTSFSPSLDYFAISTGDGRIKIWDTVKGQIQTEFADILSTDEADLYTKTERGHLSADYTCMKWLSLDRKRKRKLGCSLLILGTGSGDVLALDVSAGQLKWTASGCHPGGVSAISFSTHGTCIYTAGADGMICKIDSMAGNLLGKFKASTKAISSMSVSPDGKILGTAAGQLRIFSSDYKKIQKFSGHPGAVRCMIFTDDGKYIISSAVGEKYIAVWGIDGSKKQSASCILAMEHPAVFLDSRCVDKEGVDNAGLYVLGISEMGVCYFWYGKNVDDLRNTKPTKVSLSSEDFSKNHKGAFPTIFASKLQGINKPASGNLFVAYGLLVKPLFQKVLVHAGTDVQLPSFQDGVLLPMSHSRKSKKGLEVQSGVTALDRANAEDALIPIPKIFDFHDKKERDQMLSTNPDDVVADDLFSGKDDTGKVEVDAVTFDMEDRMRSLGILSDADHISFNSVLNSTMFEGIDLKANIPQKKMRAAVLSVVPSNAYQLLKVLLAMWQTRSFGEHHVLPWIYSILVNHGHYISSQELGTQVLDSLYKICNSRGTSIQSLLQLSGRLQLMTAQIDKAANNKAQTLVHDHNKMDESEDESEEVDELLHEERDDDSQISSEDDG